MKRDYLLGGNTTEGFFSYYDYLADAEEVRKVYIIKGGPGTGKSTTMKTVGKWGEEKGFSVDYVHCSSDPSSLDGVIIKDIGIAMVDGTSPHVVDAKNAGAVETILNMGEFWNEDAIRDNKKAIMECNKKISARFKEAYNFLEAAGCLSRNCNVHLNSEKVAQSVEKILENVPISGKGRKKVRKLFSEAITPEGIISYADTIKCENNVVLKSELYGGAGKITEVLAEKLINQGFDVELFYSPLNPETEIRNIVVPELSLSVVTSDILSLADESGAMLIDTDAFSETNTGPDYLRNKLFVMTMIQQAVRAISGAKMMHDKLESYYIPNIDFEKMEKKREEIILQLEKFAQ